MYDILPVRQRGRSTQPPLMSSKAVELLKRTLDHLRSIALSINCGRRSNTNALTSTPEQIVCQRPNRPPTSVSGIALSSCTTNQQRGAEDKITTTSSAAAQPANFAFHTTRPSYLCNILTAASLPQSHSPPAPTSPRPPVRRRTSNGRGPKKQLSRPSRPATPRLPHSRRNCRC